MQECDPGAPLTEQASSGRNPDYTHDDFAHKLKVQILPNDQENRGEFDVGTDFRIGIPMFTFELPLFFFCGAVRARSSDGHQSICKDCPFPRMRKSETIPKVSLETKATSNKQKQHKTATNHKQQTNNPGHLAKKVSTTLSEVSPCLSVLLHDEIAISLIVIPPVPKS